MASDYQEATAPTDLDIARIVLHNEAAGLTKLAHALDGSFLKALDIMESAKGRVVISGVGKSGHIANKIAATLASTGTPAQFVNAGEASHGDLPRAGGAGDPSRFAAAGPPACCLRRPGLRKLREKRTALAPV